MQSVLANADFVWLARWTAHGLIYWHQCVWSRPLGCFWGCTSTSTRALVLYGGTRKGGRGGGYHATIRHRSWLELTPTPPHPYLSYRVIRCGPNHSRCFGAKDRYQLRVQSSRGASRRRGTSG
ncbi:unnamed protein product [Tuber aestivum]|uniref:Uncharacterized protein n=1 Tax=Tuber aestivum TaxID=59557 RepID=A0A292PRW8_9PEZI|nr:unnamed protein product [Tuber aestivum]